MTRTSGNATVWGDDLMDQAWWGPQYANRLSPTQEAAEKLVAAGSDGLILLVHPGRSGRKIWSYGAGSGQGATQGGR